MSTNLHVIQTGHEVHSPVVVPEVDIVNPELGQRLVKFLHGVVWVSAHTPTIWERLSHDHAELGREKYLVPHSGLLQPANRSASGAQ